MRPQVVLIWLIRCFFSYSEAGPWRRGCVPRPAVKGETLPVKSGNKTHKCDSVLSLSFQVLSKPRNWDVRATRHAHPAFANLSTNVHCRWQCSVLGDGDDPQIFLETFRAMAKAFQWPPAEWVLLPLLSGEAQTAALSLPLTSQSSFPDTCRAVLDCMGLSPEDHPRWFRICRLTGEDRPFVWARKLHDAAARWLPPGPLEAGGNSEVGPVPLAYEPGGSGHVGRTPPGC